MSSSAGPVPGRPFFGGKKWVFWLVACLPAAMSLATDPCPKNNWPVPLLLNVMVMACLWEAHVQAIRLELAGWAMLWQACKRTLKTLASVIFAGLLPLALIALMLPPMYSCHTSDRVKVSIALSSISELRREIEHRASTAKTLKDAGLGLTLQKPEGKSLSNGFVLENGAIVLVLEDPPAAVLFTPELADANSGAVQWSCRGYPSKSVPATCRVPR